MSVRAHSFVRCSDSFAIWWSVSWRFTSCFPPPFSPVSQDTSGQGGPAYRPMADGPALAGERPRHELGSSYQSAIDSFEEFMKRCKLMKPGTLLLLFSPPRPALLFSLNPPSYQALFYGLFMIGATVRSERESGGRAHREDERTQGLVEEHILPNSVLLRSEVLP